MALLLQSAQHRPTLRLHPALRHQVQLRVHIDGLHLSVIIVISGEAEGASEAVWEQVERETVWGRVEASMDNSQNILQLFAQQL